MRKSTRRRPELEPLEAVISLSALGQAEPAVSRASAAVVAPRPPKNLTGTLRGTGQILKAQDLGGQKIPASFVATGTGNLARIGPVKFIFVSSPSRPGYYLTVTARQGQATLMTENSFTKAPNTPVSRYDFVDGGGSLLNLINPSGTLKVKQVGPVNGKGTVTLKLS